MINNNLLHQFDNARRLEKEKEIAFSKLKKRINDSTKKYASLIIHEQLELLQWLKKEVDQIKQNKRLKEIIKTLEKELNKEKAIIESEIFALLSRARKINHKELLELKNKINSLKKIDLSKYGIPGLILIINRLKENEDTKHESDNTQQTETESDHLQIRVSEIFIPRKVFKAIQTTINEENSSNKQIIYLSKNYFESPESIRELQNRLYLQDYNSAEVEKYIQIGQTIGAILINEDLIKDKDSLRTLLIKERFSRFLDLLHPDDQTKLRIVATEIINKLYSIEENIIQEPLNLYRSKHFTEDLLKYIEKKHQTAHKIISNLLAETKK